MKSLIEIYDSIIFEEVQQSIEKELESSIKIGIASYRIPHSHTQVLIHNPDKTKLFLSDLKNKGYEMTCTLNSFTIHMKLYSTIEILPLTFNDQKKSLDNLIDRDPVEKIINSFYTKKEKWDIYCSTYNLLSFTINKKQLIKITFQDPDDLKVEYSFDGAYPMSLLTISKDEQSRIYVEICKNFSTKNKDSDEIAKILSQD